MSEGTPTCCQALHHPTLLHQKVSTHTHTHTRAHTHSCAAHTTPSASSRTSPKHAAPWPHASTVHIPLAPSIICVIGLASSTFPCGAGSLLKPPGSEVPACFAGHCCRRHSTELHLPLVTCSPAAGSPCNSALGNLLPCSWQPLQQCPWQPAILQACSLQHMLQMRAQVANAPTQPS